MSLPSRITAGLAVALQRRWYSKRPAHWVLRLLSCLFERAVQARRRAYSAGHKAVEYLPVPVIVVGNLTVGGNGKTPLVIRLAECLREQGYRPGVIARGYGARLTRPTRVTAASQPAQVGDEPVLVAQRTGCPVAVFPHRVLAGRLLVEQAGCDVLIADDGLQHYGLGRDIEIVVVDGARRFGNERLLPAGPLREPLARLREVDAVVALGAASAGEYEMRLMGSEAARLGDPAERLPLARWAGLTVHGVAGIGNPERFFQHLESFGLTVIRHAFPDHHPFQASDFNFDAGDVPVVLTEKDAVKCRDFLPRAWSVAVRAKLPNDFESLILKLLSAAKQRRGLCSGG